MGVFDSELDGYADTKFRKEFRNKMTRRMTRIGKSIDKEAAREKRTIPKGVREIGRERLRIEADGIWKRLLERQRRHFVMAFDHLEKFYDDKYAGRVPEPLCAGAIACLSKKI